MTTLKSQFYSAAELEDVQTPNRRGSVGDADFFVYAKIRAKPSGREGVQPRNWANIQYAQERQRVVELVIAQLLGNDVKMFPMGLQRRRVNNHVSKKMATAFPDS
mmetsp:Transcript_41137/g.162468  ORF Transcript_41137/g.162468 Transcript_41137/m.162468 type:complete len:105 (-) Transcript_41137:238-552(-)